MQCLVNSKQLQTHTAAMNIIKNPSYTNWGKKIQKAAFTCKRQHKMRLPVAHYSHIPRQPFKTLFKKIVNFFFSYYYSIDMP